MFGEGKVEARGWEKNSDDDEAGGTLSRLAAPEETGWRGKSFQAAYQTRT